MSDRLGIYIHHILPTLPPLRRYRPNLCFWNFRREIANGDLVILIQDTWRYHFATADVGEMPEEMTHYKAITREGNVDGLRLYHLRRLYVIM